LGRNSCGLSLFTRISLIPIFSKLGGLKVGVRRRWEGILGSSWGIVWLKDKHGSSSSSSSSFSLMASMCKMMITCFLVD
jgi:hypothetical protein